MSMENSIATSMAKNTKVVNSKDSTETAALKKRIMELEAELEATLTKVLDYGSTALSYIIFTVFAGAFTVYINEMKY